ncbi:4-hydroxy-tetrahydrodipicolinate reductase [Enterobacteriaceae endosymbiont of Donacia bicoloricornis]|uniref:4-hydroxy-tetrahydrodipicolinate reductase n=1 Tax=Enterobacteriaceae endosymbiont of Donacia bicoloricornis TaxID=2675772 RepID=UPI001449C397|nr:4-hydroxy-tetrahydrodipicolinate reductase [Enterobacteriaceae endosymbiont of Donacia bicoloricornis]QJC37600.1 4-hydroxy-tetrahydrodipicolinate reductase [Enterobacteriaceae endosymbiont of Donacia bicoloricornis]
MQNNKIRLAIAGINGRMGQNILKILNTNKVNNILLNGVTEHKLSIKNKNKILYKSNFLKIKPNLIDIKDKFEILIDFTNPLTTLENINFCKKYKKKIVIGTTGFTEKQKLIINKISKNIAIVLSSNFSQGINYLLKIIENFTKILCKNKEINNLDIDIIEKHHKKKKDLPSGTALSLKDTITNICEKINIFKKITCHSIRAADLYGEHNILFSFIGEQIELTHKASNRISFAKGAINAAIWLHNKEIGIYNMHDVLGI